MTNRSGYHDFDDDEDNLACGRWLGNLKRAINGKRGQAFLRDLLDALDAMPVKRLIVDELVTPYGMCAIGSLAVKRNLDVSDIDPEDSSSLASVFGVAEPLIQEIEYWNDEAYSDITPAQRWVSMRRWVQWKIK